jgi:hypothetical protein
MDGGSEEIGRQERGGRGGDGEEQREQDGFISSTVSHFTAEEL